MRGKTLISASGKPAQHPRTSISSIWCTTLQSGKRKVELMEDNAWRTAISACNRRVSIFCSRKPDALATALLYSPAVQMKSSVANGIRPFPSGGHRCTALPLHRAYRPDLAAMGRERRYLTSPGKLVHKLRNLCSCPAAPRQSTAEERLMHNSGRQISLPGADRSYQHRPARLAVVALPED